MGIVPRYGFYVLNFIGIDVKHASSSDHPGASHGILYMLLGM